MGCQETGDPGQKESPEAEKREISSPALGEKETPQPVWVGTWLESNFSVKALGIVVDTKGNMTHSEGDPSFLLSPAESTPGVLLPSTNDIDIPRKAQ